MNTFNTRIQMKVFVECFCSRKYFNLLKIVKIEKLSLSTFGTWATFKGLQNTFSYKLLVEFNNPANMNKCESVFGSFLLNHVATTQQIFLKFCLLVEFETRNNIYDTFYHDFF